MLLFGRKKVPKRGSRISRRQREFHQQRAYQCAGGAKGDNCDLMLSGIMVDRAGMA
jgi:hypothetical protein